MTPLPTVDDPVLDPAVTCTGCGKCCETQGTPPFFAVFYPPPGVEMYAWAKGCEDHAYWSAAPPEARELLGAYYAALRGGAVTDRHAAGLPCLWYDEATAACRYYHNRPSICREFEVGSVWCLNYRHAAGLGPDPETLSPEEKP